MSTVKERPILFSGEMIRAILSGQKTVTRRPVKKPRGFPERSYCDPYAMPPALWWWSEIHEHIGVRQACPLGQVGDRLWVRETWSDVNAYGAHTIVYRADDHIRYLGEEDEFLDEHGCLNLLDPRIENLNFSTWFEDLLAGTEGRWRPSIHMPRWASRITLEITDVCVERLRSITEDEAIDEGCPGGDGVVPGYSRPATPTEHFRDVWAGIYGLSSWDENPWVWCISFRRIES